jgi:hypothetical protein
MPENVSFTFLESLFCFSELRRAMPDLVCAPVQKVFAVVFSDGLNPDISL